MPKRRFICPECGKRTAEKQGCVCKSCGRALLDDAKREMFGDDAEWINDDMGNQ